ncbi:MAG: DUF1459 domain-containing protein [Methylobacter sp.]|nr:DUF1459 domain-containing protein [Methylobacter sp.]
MKHLAVTLVLAWILFALDGCALYVTPYYSGAYYSDGYAYPYYRSYGFEPRFHGYYGFRPHFYGRGRGWRGYGRH